ncbi:MAG: 1-acyl-sn-glycerol-3-phosphate acyltransferase [Reichenbachiella sp.]
MQVIRFVWYFSFWLYVKLALYFYFKEIKVVGLKNIPKGPVIIGANHENALIDPLLMTTSVPRFVHYLVRADIFKNPYVKKLLASWNLMPVYRARDGVNSVKANQEIFQACFEAFKVGESLMLFPEAAHDHRRVVKAAKKGISRIAHGGVNQENAPKELYIVPSGLTYSGHMSFRSSVIINFGEPMKVPHEEPSQKNIDKLKVNFDNELWKYHAAMPRDSFPYMNSILYHDQSPKVLIDIERNNQMARVLDDKLTGVEKEEIIEGTKELENLGITFPFEYRENHLLNAIAALLLLPFGLVGFILNVVAILVPWNMMKGFKDKVFYDTIHFAIGLVALPLFTFGYAMIVYWTTHNVWYALGFVVMNPILLLAYNRMVREFKLFRSNANLKNNKDVLTKYRSFIEKIAGLRKSV